MIFKEDEIPFEELSEIGITKENFLTYLLIYLIGFY